MTGVADVGKKQADVLEREPVPLESYRGFEVYQMPSASGFYAVATFDSHVLLAAHTREEMRKAIWVWWERPG